MEYILLIIMQIAQARDYLLADEKCFHWGYRKEGNYPFATKIFSSRKVEGLKG